MEPSHARVAAERILQRVGSTLAASPEGFPVHAHPHTGAWWMADDGFWTGGFWLSCLWALASRGEVHVGEVESWLERLSPRLEADTSLRGLLFWYGAGLGDRLCTHSRARELGIAGARALVASRHDRSGVIPLGDAFGESPDPAVVEMNIDGLAGTAALCGWAADKTGDGELRAAAISDAQVHADLLVRPDGSTWQAAALDRAAGYLLDRHTQKGADDGSTWSRGQAWAILGFTQAAYWLAPTFAKSALATADWWCAATKSRRVPPWDFAEPDGPPDTSAAAIAARALLALADLPGNGGRPYRQVALETLTLLVQEHMTVAAAGEPRPAGMLLDGCYNRRARWAHHHELIWGDWFLLEALLVVSGAVPEAWSP